MPTGDPAEIGYPLVVKAAAGGGGRGMRVVRDPADLDDALAAAQREAQAAFGDDRVFCERYVERPRHVEIQLAAGGEIVALGERECSIQRRHQKVLEESPAVGPELRERMSEAAVAFARAIGYRSLGTAEFMVAGDEFFFLELNGRIQVEHPVTELVTGLDLVALQLRIAEDAAASPPGDSLLQGHAVEVRLYAEHPLTFLPQTGRIERLRLPEGVRVDAGVAEGDEVGVAYDPMIAKLIAHGETRDEALDRLADALAETEVAGVTTNLPFLRWLVRHPRVRAGETTTAFLVGLPAALAVPARAERPVARRVPAQPAAASAPLAARRRRRDAQDHGPGGESSALTAPMPGTVIKVLAEPGQSVAQREPLIVLEAMKMETPVVSPYEAVVKAVHVAEGDLVSGGQLLVELEE